MGKVRELWLGDIENWLTGYSAYVRAASRGPHGSFLFTMDLLLFETGHAQGVRFPRMKTMDLLRDRVDRDWEIPPTQEEMDALPDFKAFHRKLLTMSMHDLREGNLPENCTCDKDPTP